MFSPVFYTRQGIWSVLGVLRVFTLLVCKYSRYKYRRRVLLILIMADALWYLLITRLIFVSIHRVKKDLALIPKLSLYLRTDWRLETNIKRMLTCRLVSDTGTIYRFCFVRSFVRAALPGTPRITSRRHWLVVSTDRLVCLYHFLRRTACRSIQQQYSHYDLIEPSRI